MKQAKAMVEMDSQINELAKYQEKSGTAAFLGIERWADDDNSTGNHVITSSLPLSAMYHYTILAY